MPVVSIACSLVREGGREGGREEWGGEGSDFNSYQLITTYLDYDED